jgi:hypothetical protein
MKKLLLSALLAVGLISAYALAQTPPGNTTISVPKVQTVGPTDLFQDVVAGIPQVGNQYATAGQIAGVPQYVYTVPLTGFSLTFGNSQLYYILNPAGTLATGTITMAPNPADGQRECIVSEQTQTAITFTANTGQTISTAPTIPTALVAGTPVCYTWVAAQATWYKA